jgi:hypothetical protein
MPKNIFSHSVLRQVAWMFDAVFVEVFDLAKVRCAD